MKKLFILFLATIPFAAMGQQRLIIYDNNNLGGINYRPVKEITIDGTQIRTYNINSVSGLRDLYPSQVIVPSNNFLTPITPITTPVLPSLPSTNFNTDLPRLNYTLPSSTPTTQPNPYRNFPSNWQKPYWMK